MCGGVYCLEQKSTYLRSKLEVKIIGEIGRSIGYLE